MRQNAKFSKPPTTKYLCLLVGALSGESLSDPSELEGLTVLSLGTTLAMKTLSRRRVFDASRGVYSHLVPAKILFKQSSTSAFVTGEDNFWLAGGASQAGCRILRDCGFTVEELTQLSLEIPINVTATKDLYPLPLNSKGERFPTADGEKSSNVQASKYSNRQTLLQDILLGITQNVELEGYKVLRELGGPVVTRIVTTGGGSRNDNWTALRRRLISKWLDELGEQTISVAAAPGRNSAYGAALIALRSHQLRKCED